MLATATGMMQPQTPSPPLPVDPLTDTTLAQSHPLSADCDSLCVARAGHSGGRGWGADEQEADAGAAVGVGAAAHVGNRVGSLVLGMLYLHSRGDRPPVTP